MTCKDVFLSYIFYSKALLKEFACHTSFLKSQLWSPIMQLVDLVATVTMMIFGLFATMILVWLWLIPVMIQWRDSLLLSMRMMVVAGGDVDDDDNHVTFIVYPFCYSPTLVNVDQVEDLSDVFLRYLLDIIFKVGRCLVCFRSNLISIITVAIVVSPSPSAHRHCRHHVIKHIACQHAICF